MTIREIEKEGFIKFEEKDKSREVSQEEYDQLIEEAFIMQCKYCGGKVNPELRKKYNLLDKRTKTINKIKAIFYVVDARMGRRCCSLETNNFIVVEDMDGICLLYNISTGEDFSFKNDKELIFIKGKTKIIKLYEFNEKDYQRPLSLGYMKSIKLYKMSGLENSISNKQLAMSDILVFEDVFDNKFFVDVLFNNLYVRSEYISLVRSKNVTKSIDIFIKGKEIKLKKNIFSNMWFKTMSIFFEFVDE